MPERLLSAAACAEIAERAANVNSALLGSGTRPAMTAKMSQGERGFIERGHAEGTCQECGGPNVVWFAPNDVWNLVMDGYDGILCPTCFIARARLAGLDVPWRIAPESDIDMTESAMTLYAQARREIATLRHELTASREDIPALLATVAALREAVKPFGAFAVQMRDDAECHRTWMTDEAQRDLQQGSAYLEKHSPRDIAGDADWHKRWFDFYNSVADAMERAAAVYEAVK